VKDALSSSDSILDSSPEGTPRNFPSPLFQDPPQTIPDHELLRLIGTGSYGQVWLARNSATGSLRAVKIVYRKTFDNDRPYNREFEGIKRLEPISQARESQVDIFHVGRNDSAEFFIISWNLRMMLPPLL
jgi:hypothetical protein